MDNFLVGKEIQLSSKEVAELTGKEHRLVMRDIREMLDELKKDQSKYGAVFLDSYKREQPCFNLPKRELMILLTGYSIPLRAKVIDRLEELEQAQKPKTMNKLELFQASVEAMMEEREQRKLLEAAHVRLAEEHGKLEEKVDTAIDDSILSSIEQGQLNAAIDNKAKIYGQVKFNGYIKRDLKNRYFGVSAGKQRTFKEIPRKHFKDAIEFVHRWIPSPTY